MRSKPIERVCEICGKHFFTRASNVAKGKGKLCSRKCAYEHRKQSPRKRMTRICQRCGKEFPTVKRNAKHCSVGCKWPPLLKQCLNCGIEFRVSPSASDAKYCSKHCANTSDAVSAKRRENVTNAWKDPEKRARIMEGIKERSQSEAWLSAPHFQKGIAHPRYKGNKQARDGVARYAYKKWKSDVLKKDNYTCQKCGKRGGFLEVHHIEHWALAPDLRYEVTNGMAVCEDCHLAIHGNKRTPRTRNCETCGTAFRPRIRASRFCSIKCSAIARRKP